MQLRDFAETVLFATTLEEKLRPPGALDDDRPGPALDAPPAPGRPPELRFRAQDTPRPEFPGRHGLERAHERGRLLHFFANHELLATELMALVLLRFPEAPPAFRRGVLKTLQDEQEHTRWYMERMKVCGLEFGALPVSGWFWRCVAPMENPIDYVAGLCLTFEQANLDYARHFAEGFATVGDAATAALLERIYRDEIGHVAYGLKWFRRWKNPSESDWAAFCRTLKFPLSPQRAKGFRLNVEGRREAGLDAAFIAELDVYAQSRGRTANVYVFNPFAEGFLARGRAFNPTAPQARLARDLACLPQFLARQDDLVLVPEKPATEFLRTVKRAGFDLPEFAVVPGGRIDLAAAGLANRKLGRLRPWAWGPDSLRLLAPLWPLVHGEDRPAARRFSERWAALYSKVWSADFLRRALTALAGHEAADLLNPPEVVGLATRSAAETLEAIDAFRARGYVRLVVKEAIGVAGHNSLRVWEVPVPAAQRRWIERALRPGGELVVEPWLERVVDFSVQFEMETAGLRLAGYTGLCNDPKGQYRGNWADPDYPRRLPDAVAACFPGQRDVGGRLRRFYGELRCLLETDLRAADFVGPAGLDAFVYRTPDGAPRLKPVVELNPRYTMGRVLVELMRQAGAGRGGSLRLWNRSMVCAAGFDGFPAFAASLAERHPPRLEGQPVPRLVDGALCLNDPARAEAVLAVFRVGRSLDDA